jgi:hypothetical protein
MNKGSITVVIICFFISALFVSYDMLGKELPTPFAVSPDGEIREVEVFGEQINMDYSMPEGLSNEAKDFVKINKIFHGDIYGKITNDGAAFFTKMLDTIITSLSESYRYGASPGASLI